VNTRAPEIKQNVSRFRAVAFSHHLRRTNRQVTSRSGTYPSSTYRGVVTKARIGVDKTSTVNDMVLENKSKAVCVTRIRQTRTRQVTRCSDHIFLKQMIRAKFSPKRCCQDRSFPSVLFHAMTQFRQPASIVPMRVTIHLSVSRMNVIHFTDATEARGRSYKRAMSEAPERVPGTASSFVTSSGDTRTCDTRTCYMTSKKIGVNTTGTL